MTWRKPSGFPLPSFFHVLKERFGISPFAYHAERRLERAREMIKTDRLPLTSYSLGARIWLKSAFLFGFQKKFGASPSQCRKNL